MHEILVYLSIIYEGDWNKIYKSILDKEPINKEEVLNRTKGLNCNYVTLLDSNYPLCLKSIYKPPFVIFYKGDITLLDEEKLKVAVIGSRLNSEYGKNVTERICMELIKEREDCVIVSGLAKGIDSIAHITCLQNNGKTIAVLGNGLDIIYPKENEFLYKEIGEHGLIISEYPPGVFPNKSNFPCRNRILAGISSAIVVMEAKEKSGTMNTVSYGLEEGKQIFCVPNKCNTSSGCNKLIKEGAKLIENAKDILEDL